MNLNKCGPDGRLGYTAKSVVILRGGPTPFRNWLCLDADPGYNSDLRGVKTRRGQEGMPEVNEAVQGRLLINI